MRREGGTQIVIAGDHVENARRQDPAGELAQEQPGQRGEGGGLQDDRVARQQCRRDLPHRQGDGEVPRDDGGDHADRDVADARGVHLIVHGRPSGQFDRGEGAGPFDRTPHLAACGGQGLALLGREEAGQVLGMRLERIRVGEDVLAALFPRPGAPGAEGRTGCGDGLVQLRGVRGGSMSEDGLGRGVHDRERRSRAGDRGAVDREGEGRGEVRGGVDGGFGDGHGDSFCEVGAGIRRRQGVRLRPAWGSRPWGRPPSPG